MWHEPWYGTMRISPKNRKPFELTGTWTYSLMWNCWYLDGMSFPSEICRKVEE